MVGGHFFQQSHNPEKKKEEAMKMVVEDWLNNQPHEERRSYSVNLFQ